MNSPFYYISLNQLRACSYEEGKYHSRFHHLIRVS
ncbi:MAG: hypothetical protein RLZZ595_1817, partial [Bacteroidota bacterium]